MKRRTKTVLASVALLLVLAGAGLGLYAYLGVYLGAESGPNNEFSLRYYRSFNPFRMYWSTPGGTACEPRWIRLYDKSGNKLHELYTTSCALEMPVNWLDGQVVLPDGNTVWALPDGGGP
jgi:hypothetical protein